MGGVVIVKGASPNIFGTMLKFVIVGVAGFTWNVVVIVPDVYSDVSACEVVMVVKPALTG